MSKVDDWIKPGAIVSVDVNTTKELVDALRELMKPKAIYHGGPAFPALPISRELNGELVYQSQGVTIRDYFAAKAMQGIQSRVNWGLKEVADLAFEQADAMLEARNK